MYISSLDPQLFLEAKKMTDGAARYSLQALQDGLYDIYYEHDPIHKAVFYTALLKDKANIAKRFLSDELCFGIEESGALLGGLNFLSAPLVIFIHEAEASLNEDDLLKIYGSAYEDAALTKGLNPEQAAEKLANRKDFNAFLAKLDKVKEEKTDNENQKFDARFHFDLTYSIEVGLSVITKTGTYRIGHLYRFFEAIRSKAEYKLTTKESIIADSNSFRAPMDAAVSTFVNTGQFYSRNKVEFCLITPGGFIGLLELLVGEQIYVNGEKTVLEQSDPVSISLDKNGKPVFYPPFENRDNYSYDNPRSHYEGKNGVFVIARKGHSIVFHPYGSAAVKETYQYFKDHQEADFSYIKDLFVSKLLPKISSSLKAPAVSKGNAPSFLIRLYISFDEKTRLSFKSTYEENGGEVKRKDIQSEYGKSLTEAYLALLASLGGLEHGNISSQEAIYDFLTKDLSSLSKVAQIYYEDRLKPGQVSKVNSLRIDAHYDNDFLGLTLDSEEYDKEELKAILAAKHQKKKFVLLKNKTILLDSPELDEAAEIFDSDELEIENAPIYRLFSLEGSQISVKADKPSQNVLRAIKDFDKTPISLPESLDSILRPYQRSGVRYLSTLANYGLGGILADEMGLGKTVQAIAYLVASMEELPSIILSPKAVLYNWLSEINRFSSLDATIIDGPRSKREAIIASIERNRKAIYLVSYDTFRRDADLFEGILFSSAILDEAQSVKNAFSQRHMALSKILANHRFALTGTPLENSPMDLWSIYDFLMPGYLGNIDKFGRFIASSDYQGLLASLLKPFTLRRKKEDVLKDLPPKTETNILIQMEEDQRMIYLAYLNKAREQEDVEDGSRLSVLAALTRLRQICVDPASFLEDYDAVSSKLNYCKDMLLELKGNGHKALVFSSFKTVLNHLKEICEDEGLKVGIITGDTSGKDRLDLANAFNSEEGEIDVMLVSLKAGGVGLNLIGADMVIHLDPWWNPASESQASDRAHRIGQTRPVTIFRLIAKDSIEEKVQLLQENKRHLFDDLIEESGGASKLTDEDIRFLLS